MLYACIAALAAAAGGLILRSEYEKKHFVTDHYRISSKKIKGQKRDFVFLSDLHNNEFGVNNRLLIEEIDRIHPDAVLIGGDMMVSRGEADLRVTLSLVRELAITDTVSRFRFCRRMSWSAIAAGRISRGFKSCCCIRRCFLITAATGEPI